MENEKNNRRRRKDRIDWYKYKEYLLNPSHIINSRFASGELDRNKIELQKTGDFLTDGANFPGGKTDEVVHFKAGSGEAEIADVVLRCVRENKTIVVRGAGTSLTGAVVPKNDVVLNMFDLKNISEIKEIDEKYGIVTVQPGATFGELQTELRSQGYFLPASPTYDLATVGGGVNTDAGGARGYKYGKMRKWVQGVKLMLSNGEVIDVQRGQHFAHKGDAKSPGGYFILKREDGTRQKITVPSYETPSDVPKVSAGIYSQPSKTGRRGMDLVDLIVGSEGTLGIITEVTLKVIKEPPTAMMLVACENDKQAISLMMKLRKQEPEKRETFTPGGISAVEIIGSNAVDLLREKGKDKDIPETAKSLLLVQVEMPNEDDSSLVKFLETCEEFGVNTESQIKPVMPTDNLEKKDELTAIREAVPHAVNELIAKNIENSPGQGITKVGSDGCVNPIYSADVIMLYKDAFDKAGLKWFFWGHGEGNFHVNAAPETGGQTEIAKKIIEECGRIVIKKFKGIGTSEHGIGKNPTKLKLFLAKFGYKGLREMHAIMDAFDPLGIFAPGNLGKLRRESEIRPVSYTTIPSEGIIYNK